MRRIYSSPGYQMGSVDAPAPMMTNSEIEKAKRELSKMKRSLKSWLRFRKLNDAISEGRASEIRSPLLKRPGAKLPPGQVQKMLLVQHRYKDEQPLAIHLHTLLSEVFDSSLLPSPDLNRDPNAAVKLAEIAVSGKLPEEASAPSPQGFIWMWPLALVVAGVVFVIVASIKTQADLAKERERLDCVRAGKCTDYGFWLKMAAMLGIGWFVWEKAGVGKRVQKAIGG